MTDPKAQSRELYTDPVTGKHFFREPKVVNLDLTTEAYSPGKGRSWQFISCYGMHYITGDAGNIPPETRVTLLSVKGKVAVNGRVDEEIGVTYPPTRPSIIWKGTISDILDSRAMRIKGHPLVYNSDAEVVVTAEDSVGYLVEDGHGSDPTRFALQLRCFELIEVPDEVVPDGPHGQ